MSERVYSAVDALAWLVECNLATLDELEMLKSSSASRIRRQKSICDDAVLHFRQFGSVVVAHRLRCTRLAKILEAQ